MKRRKFIEFISISLSAFLGTGFHSKCTKMKKKKPNILLAIADDWSWPHAGITGIHNIKTPAFDRVAEEGVLFNQAYCSAPSCTPSRGSILVGQYPWRLEQNANLWSTLPERFVTYPEILENNNYVLGYTGKGWGPGNFRAGGRSRNPAGPVFNSLKCESPKHVSRIDYASNFRMFLANKPKEKPFCFWYGSHEPHLKYKEGIGLESGKSLEDARVPEFLPDNEIVRGDLLDYFYEVEWFDQHLGRIIQILEKTGELDNTILVCTSDNGMPFPRCKSNLYDMGTKIPLAVRWGEKVKGGRVVEDFVNLSDIAPTFLEAVGVKVPEEMTGKSFLDILFSSKSGRVNPIRDKVFTGKERHAWVRKEGLGYPMRAVRTDDYLYIRNFKPERWPSGDPDNFESNDPPIPYGDIDHSLTKQFMIDNKDDPEISHLFHLAFEKRPAEELYDLQKDHDQMHNIADNNKYAEIKKQLEEILIAELKDTRDPRILGHGDVFDHYRYYGPVGK